MEDEALLEDDELIYYYSDGKRKKYADNQPMSTIDREILRQKMISDVKNLQDKLEGQHLQEQTKKILQNVYYYFKFEKEFKGDLIPANQTLDRCELATGIPIATFKRVLKPENPKIEPEKRESVTDLDSFKRDAVRQVMHSFYRKNLPLTIKMLQCELDKISMHFSLTSLWIILGKLGFRYKNRRSRLFVYQRPDVMQKRDNYIRRIIELRTENRLIYYQDETWFNAGHIREKGWVPINMEDEENLREAMHPGSLTTLGYTDPSGKGSRLIISHIGSKVGFLPTGADIFVSKKTGDYHEDMNAERYEKHMEANVFPYLPPNSVLVMDNAPYHSRQIDKIPSSSSTKARMIEWLNTKGIQYDPKSKKKNLVAIIKNSCATKKYYIDETAKLHGIEILRLPPYHCELNPIELVWGILKGRVAKKNTTFKITDVKEIFENEVKQFDAETWEHCVNHVRKFEDKYAKYLGKKIEVKPLVISLDSSDSESEESSDGFSSDDSDEL